MADLDSRRRTYSTQSYFSAPAATTNQHDGTFLDNMSCRDPSFDLPRLTEEEVAEIIAEGPAIRKRMERHKIDVEFVLECNTMLLEWVAMRERLLRQWARVPAELIVPPATTVPPQQHAPPPTPPPSAGLPRARQSSLGSLPPLGSLLHRKRARSLRDRATEVIAKNQLVAGLKRSIKPRRKVVIDLHAELLRYDELLRGLKERFDDRDMVDEGDEDDEEGQYAPSFQDVAYDAAYEADEESLTSPVVEQTPIPRAPPRHMLPNPRYPWRIPEAPEPGSDDEDTDGHADKRGADSGTKASSGDTYTDTETETGDTSSIRTATRESSVPPSPFPPTPNTFNLDDRLGMTATVSSGGTHATRGTYTSHSTVASYKTIGVLSDAMQMEARSILGSECTGDTFGLRSYTSSAGDYVSLGRDRFDGDSYRSNVSGVDQDFSVLLDKMLVFDETLLNIGVGGGETKEERERALGGAGRSVRVANDMRARTVTEFGVRTRSFTAPITATPFPTPMGSTEGAPHATAMTQSASAMANLPSQIPTDPQHLFDVHPPSVALGGMTIHTFTPKGRHAEADSFHPMEQFADASTQGSR